MQRFKVGDTARVIGNGSFHRFEIGSIVEIVDVSINSYRCKRQSGEWYVQNQDLEIIETEQTGMQIKKGDKFKCIKDIIKIRPNGKCTYYKNGIYMSEHDGCITDVGKDSWPVFNVEGSFQKIEEKESRVFDSGAVRDSNKGKSRPDLISPYFTERLGNRLAYGIEQGYEANNWKRGMSDEVFLESLERHLIAYKMGKTDEDHAGAIAFNIMGIIHNEEVRKTA